MTPDDITRLADIAERLDRVHSLLELSQEQECRESMAAKVDYASSALLGAQFALTELRATLTLAQQGKAGGVAIPEAVELKSDDRLGLARSGDWVIVTSPWSTRVCDARYAKGWNDCRREHATPPANSPDAGVTAVGWINEDELPKGYPYDAMFPHSKVDGVRLFPVFAPQPKDAT